MDQRFEELLMQIDDAMNKWLVKYGFSAISSGLEEEFSWYHTGDTISYTFLACADTDKVFDDFIYKELGCLYDIGTFWTSWFHELGHSETWYLLTENDRRNFPLDLIDYIHCSREIIASKWAVDFINNNIEKVVELASEVDALRQQIYNL